MLAIAVIKAVMPAFFSGKPLKEIEIGFPVLNAVFAFLGRSHGIELCIDDTSFIEQGLENVLAGLLLEYAAVLHQRQAP